MRKSYARTIEAVGRLPIVIREGFKNAGRDYWCGDDVNNQRRSRREVCARTVANRESRGHPKGFESAGRYFWCGADVKNGCRFST